MADLKHSLPMRLLKVLDLALVVLSFGFTTALLTRMNKTVSLREVLAMRAKLSDVLLFILILFGLHVIFRIAGLYQSRRMSPNLDEVIDTLKAVTVSILLLIGISWIFSASLLRVPFILIFSGVNLVLLCASHATLRMVLSRARARGRNLRYVLILGTNDRAVAFARKLQEDPQRGYRVVGFVDDDWAGMGKFRRSGSELACDYAGLAEYLRHNVVDEAVAYLPFASCYRHWSEVSSLCAQHGIILRLNPDNLGLDNPRWLGEGTEGSQYLAAHAGTAEGWPLAFKRTLDITISLTFLLLLSPLLLTVALAIKLTSPGPVLFLQDRIGLNKRSFAIWKFRTMVPNAEKLMASLQAQNEVSGPVFKMRKDPRITPIGKLLRRSSIDELPQLVNVLKGDMSLVGPRPLPIRDYLGFSEDWQRRRLSVKPGITCLWQVGGRSGISFDEWMELDLKYMDTWSFWLDLKILARTVSAVLRGSGAV